MGRRLWEGFKPSAHYGVKKMCFLPMIIFFKIAAGFRSTSSCFLTNVESSKTMKI